MLQTPQTIRLILHNYDPDWSSGFEQLEAAYRLLLGELILRVEHVGSTAIHGIAAKPILDIDLVIPDDSCFPAVKEKLEKVGYLHCGDQGIPGREVFKRMDEGVPHFEHSGSWMQHHLYLCVDGSRELDRHVAFRDYLNAHPDARSEYEAIKLAIEHRSNGDRKVYADLKEHEGECTAFVERVLKKVEQSAAHDCGDYAASK